MGHVFWATFFSLAMLLGCERTTSQSTMTDDATGCRVWQPSRAAWSSLATTRPARMSSWSVSASGKLLYGVGNWLEAGELRSSLFRSSDLGQSWCILSKLDRIDNVAASPADDAHVYGTRFSDYQLPLELVRTTDGGATWSVASLPVNEAVLLPSQSDPDVLQFSALSGTPWVSSDGGESWGEIAIPAELGDLLSVLPVFDRVAPERILLQGIGDSRRVFVTLDGGMSWLESSPPVNESSGAPSIPIVTGPASALYAWSGSSLAVSGDWGQSWTPSGPMPGGAAPLWGSVPTAEALYVGAAAALWRSFDQGASFEPIPTPDEFQPLVAGAPDPDSVIGEVAGSLVVTTDAGHNWSTRPRVPRPSVLVQSPVSPWPVWSMAPNALSTDGGISWNLTSETGAIIPDGRNPNAAFLFGEGSELRHTTDGGKTWQLSNTPPDVAEIHGVASCAAPLNCLYFLYGRTGRPLEGSALASDMARSLDGGRTWEDSLPLPVEAFYQPEVMAVSPDSADHLIASGGSGLMETRDAGRTWTDLDLTGEMRVSSIALFPGGVGLAASNNLGAAEDVVLRTTDDGATWQRLDVSPGELFVSHAHPGTVFLVNGNVFRSDDSGATWSRVSPELDMGFASVADAPNGKFIATERDLGLVEFE